MFEIITIDELLRRLNNHNHKELHVHHTWRPSHKDFTGDNGVQLQENMKRYHVNTNGWSDIGQHVTLLLDGRFVTGRPFDKAPASITGFNTGAFCMEMLGDFDIGKDKFEGKQKESALKLTKYFLDKKRNIRFHNEGAAKTCPGSSINKATFIAEAKAIGAKQATPAPVAKNATTKTLRLGDKGEEVIELQLLLNKYSYKLKPDGGFGILTQGAVKDFQRTHNLAADGMVGSKTWAELRRK